MNGSAAPRVDVAVIGDGLIGLSSALHLQMAGFRVAVIGAERAGRASTAAAGMLTPACEYDPWMPGEFLALLTAGLRYYAGFLCGWVKPEDVGYRCSDFTLLDLKETQETLRERMEWMPGLGFECAWLSAEEVCRREPQLSPRSFRGGIRIRNQAVVNPILLRERLDVEVTRRGAERLGAGFAGVDDKGERFEIRCGDGKGVVADRVLIAAGSWSGAVGSALGVRIPVGPVKGQMIRLSGTTDLVGSVIFMPAGGCGSIVQRAPGCYIAGTSEEYLEPTADNSAGVIGAILGRLTNVLPAAAHWRIEEIWSGFRPMTGDELPVLGAAPDARIHVATGHHRNGVLLAPITGKIIADVFADGPSVDLTPFRVDRQFRPHSRFADKY